MLSYYNTIILLTWMALSVLSILVWESGWIPKSEKKSFYIPYALVALASLAEWLGIQMSGNESVPRFALLLVKCADYILTPLAGGAIVGQMKLRSRWHQVLIGLLVANTVFQILAAFNGWMIVIDTHNHYTHGPCYFIYIVIYLLVSALIIVEFHLYGRSFRRQNRVSLYAILVLVLVGVGLQEVSGGEIRTAYLSLTMGLSFLFIHYSAFYQMTADDRIEEQQVQIMRDALTGTLSRFAYAKALKEWAEPERVPADLAAFSIDINDLKTINDRMGHDAGDELIIGAARCIEKALGGRGECYRTGGDEFVLLARMDRMRADELLGLLERETGAWHGETVKTVSVSAGYALASDHPDLSAEKLVREADQAMYAAKAAYYRRSGHDRRSRR